MKSNESRPRVRTKVCGIRSPEAARACSEAGADFAGLNFVPWSRRHVTLERAAECVESLGSVVPVGVFYDPAEAEILALADRLNLQWIQLHGQESPSFCEALAKRFRIIKALAVGPDFNPENLKAYVDGAELFLLDAPHPGQGTPFSWEVIQGFESPRPFLLAGGLTLENLTEAVHIAQPFGIDIASGVEEDGDESPTRILEVVRKAKSL